MIVVALVALASALAQDAKVELVRVQGNPSVTDAEIIEIAGISVGEPFAEADAAAIEARLLDSGKFESVEVRVRYRGLDETGDVAIILLVHEKPPAASRFMIGPLLDWSDEYGVTFGGRVAVVDLPADGRVSFPLSWGGERRAAIAASFGNARVELSRWRQVNPHYDVPDNRVELGGGYRWRYRFAFVDVRARWSDVDFAGNEDRFVTVGAKAAIDTRIDPTVPGDALYLALDWRRLFFDDRGETADVDQFVVDARGYKRLWGQALLAGQWLWTPATGPLPAYERPFIGGGRTLRGTRAGRFVGDDSAVATLELRLPLTSPLSFGRGGVHFFYDTAAVYDEGESLGAATWHQGVGTGLFFNVAIIGVRLDVGWNLEGGARFHIASTMKF